MRTPERSKPPTASHAADGRDRSPDGGDVIQPDEGQADVQIDYIDEASATRSDEMEWMDDSR